MGSEPNHKISGFFLKISRRYWHIHGFFKSNTFISNARLKLAKSQANAVQHPRLNFCYLKVIQILHQYYHPKVIGHILKTKETNKCVCIHLVIRLIIMKMKNWSHRYDINRPKPGYSTYKKSFQMLLLICIKQHISNIWSSVHEKVKQHRRWVE